jgi:hypothetical protein
MVASTATVNGDRLGDLERESIGEMMRPIKASVPYRSFIVPFAKP